MIHVMSDGLADFAALVVITMHLGGEQESLLAWLGGITLRSKVVWGLPPLPNMLRLKAEPRC